MTSSAMDNPMALPGLKVSEDALQSTVLEMAQRLGLRTAHFAPALTPRGRWITAVKGDGKGWPDLVVCGPGGLLFRELKSAKGQPSPEQRLWIDALAAAGADVAVWRPADLTSGRVEAELRAIRRAA